MEENVALDSKKKKKFLKSIRGIKKLIKKNEKAEPQKKDETVKPKKPFSMKLKDGKINKKKRRKERGLVYLSHIPHGFYEHQMTQYFKQFGVVTNVRVIKSKRTGQSKGFAFVEFMEPAVGQIVAETMNNYLMGKRLIKAAYIPPEKQKRNAFRKNWNSVNNPGCQKRLKLKKAFNADKDENGELKRAKKLLSNLTKNKKKLSELGINYDFFTPVDIPEALLNEAIKEEKKDDSIKQESIPKKTKKGKQEQTEDKKEVQSKKVEINKLPQQNINEVKGKKNKKNKQENKEVVAEVENKSKIVEAKKENVTKVGKKEKVPAKVNEKQQKEKEQKLKNAGVKPAQEFIKIDEDSGDESDSSYAFDSDEYEKMLEEENNSDLPSGESNDDDEASEDNEESDEEAIPTKFVKKGKSAPKVAQPAQGKKQVQNQQSPKQTVKQEQKKPPVETTRKAPQKPAAKKPKKFEKHSQKPMKKQFKKK